MDNSSQATPVGYKQTDIGVIPNDWDVNDLSSVINVYRGGSPRPIESYLTASPNGVNWVKIGDVKNGAKYIESTEEKIIPEGISRSRQVHSGDFLLSNSMSFGRPYILKIDGCIHDGWLVLQDYKDTFDREFLYYILGSEIVIKQYLSKAAGSSVLNLNKELVSSVRLLTPKLPEQSAIASVLSDIDSLIQKTEKLIAKKKAIKQGAMQELLTGKRRLPGFSGEWKKKKLEEIANFYDNLRIPVAESKREAGTTLYYGANGVQGYIKGYTHNGEFVLLAEDGANDLNNYPVLYVNGKIWVNNHAHVIQGINEHVKTKYLSYALKTINFVEVLVGGTRAKLNGSVAKTIKVLIPIDIKEQTAIAIILSDMESEVEKLEQKLEKFNQIKQGAMQVLLTGKIRLIKN